jgi:hypothetical protein
MSRGLGIWQRRILTALDECEPLPVRLLLSPKPTRAERNALSRAVRLLETKRRINVHRFMCWANGNHQTWVCRLGFPFADDRKRYEGQSKCWQDSKRIPYQHLTTPAKEGQCKSETA